MLHWLLFLLTIYSSLRDIAVSGQQFSCDRDDISAVLVKNCANAVRLQPSRYSFGCSISNPRTHALRPNSQLAAAAQKHASDMAANNYFSHTSRDGRRFSTRIRNEGYRGNAIAENIARGYSTAFAVVRGWMCSSGHRRNLMNCDYDEVGTGVDCSRSRCYAVQVYGCSTRNCCSTGGQPSSGPSGSGSTPSTGSPGPGSGSGPGPGSGSGPSGSNPPPSTGVPGPAPSGPAPSSTGGNRYRCRYRRCRRWYYRNYSFG